MQHFDILDRVSVSLVRHALAASIGRFLAQTGASFCGGHSLFLHYHLLKNRSLLMDKLSSRRVQASVPRSLPDSEARPDRRRFLRICQCNEAAFESFFLEFCRWSALWCANSRSQNSFGGGQVPAFNISEQLFCTPTRHCVAFLLFYAISPLRIHRSLSLLDSLTFPTSSFLCTLWFHS